MTEALGEVYRKHRKSVAENLGLIIALAASTAAIWTGYEARHARLEAANAAEQSLKVQRDSVNAQITTMRVDERPYIRVMPVGVKPADKEDRDDGYPYQAVFNLVAVGRTPATFLNWNVYCRTLDANQIGGAIEREADKGPPNAPPDADLIVLRETSFNRTTNREAVLNNGESISVNCIFSKEDYKSGKDDVDIDLAKEITNDKSTMMTFIVDVAYSDVFDSKHKTQQCFYVPNGDSPIHAKLLSCKKFTPFVQ